MADSPVTGLAFPCVYVDDVEAARTFYETYLGFKPEQTHPDGAVFGSLGPTYMWLGGGYETRETTTKSVRTTTMLQIESAGALMAHLKKDGRSTFKMSR